jgi:hypothetical protein
MHIALIAAMTSVEFNAKTSGADLRQTCAAEVQR